MCRLTVCQTTRSAHPGRGVGFLTEYSYLKPRSLLCGCERDRRLGPDRDSFARWPMHRLDVLFALNVCFECFVGVFESVCGLKLIEFRLLSENK